jgi:hypothetical protein
MSPDGRRPHDPDQIGLPFLATLGAAPMQVNVAAGLAYDFESNVARAKVAVVKILGVETGRPDGTQSGRGELGRLLQRNAELRGVFSGDAVLRRRLTDLQRWQSARLLSSHADLRADPRYRKAVEFFFQELYGGRDPGDRDRDLARVHRVMERLLPRQALRALTRAVGLEVMSQELDAEVARRLPPGPITTATYVMAYRQAGQVDERRRQIELLGIIGAYLDEVAHRPLVHALVRLARGPAHAAGFGALQDLLERGLDAFEAMDGSAPFLAIIRERELEAMERILAGQADPFGFDAAGRARTHE